MSEWTPLVPGSGEDAAERATRESQHQVLIELLGAYADRELPPETTSQLEAHLVGCARCRRELALHHAMRRRLGVEPVAAAAPALRDRIIAAVAATPVPEPIRSPADEGETAWWIRNRVLASIVVAVIVFILGAATVAVWRARADASAIGQLQVSPSSVPLLREVLDDYRRVTSGDLPGRARDLDAVRSALPFPIAPLRSAEVRLLGAWTTDLQGEPAAVLAYRWQDRIVLEYLVAEERFFQHPDVRRAVAGGRLLAASDGSQHVVAWPTESAGALLVGDVSLARLRALGAAQLLARTVERGAQ